MFEAMSEVVAEAKKQFPLEPLHDRIICEAHENEAKTDGGIVLPELAVERVYKTGGTATVLAVSPRGWIDDKGERHLVEVEVGDEVIFAPHGGHFIKYKGVKYLFLAEQEILAKVVKDV